MCFMGSAGNKSKSPWSHNIIQLIIHLFNFHPKLLLFSCNILCTSGDWYFCPFLWQDVRIVVPCFATNSQLDFGLTFDQANLNLHFRSLSQWEVNRPASLKYFAPFDGFSSRTSGNIKLPNNSEQLPPHHDVATNMEFHNGNCVLAFLTHIFPYLSL